MRAVLDKFHECQQPLSFQRKAKLGERRAFDAERQEMRVVIVTLERQQRASMREQRLKLSGPCHQLITVDEPDQRLQFAE